MRHLRDKKVTLMRTPTHPPSAHPCERWWFLQEGRVTFSQLICFAILGFVGLQCMKFSVYWYDNWQLEEAMQAVVDDAAFSTDAAMINTVLAKAQKLKVPLDPRQLHLERSPHRGTRLWATYDVKFTFPLGFSQTYTFHLEAQSTRR